MRIAGMVKAGQNQGANVTCMRWTSRLVTVGNMMTQTQAIKINSFLSAAATESHMTSTDDMRRCTVQYKVGHPQYFYYLDIHEI